jgi:hypothetical protein
MKVRNSNAKHLKIMAENMMSKSLFQIQVDFFMRLIVSFDNVELKRQGYRSTNLLIDQVAATTFEK